MEPAKRIDPEEDYDLPDEEEPKEEMSVEERQSRLNALGDSLARTRSEAISGRTASGIEHVWLQDEEHYEGVDDMNRGDVASLNWTTKPMGQAFLRTTNKTRSTVFPNITAPFVDAAAARIADMLLPTDDRPWKINPTPMPEMESMVKAARAEQQGLVDQGEAPPLPKKELGLRVKIANYFTKEDYKDPANENMGELESAEQQLAEAKRLSDMTQRRIEDWHVECQWHSEVRKVIEDSARIGVGVLKGPVPKAKKRIRWQGGSTDEMTGEETLGHIAVDIDHDPVSKWVDPWNCYPDPAAGEDIQNGSYFWERAHLSKKQVRDLLKENGYIKEQILAVMEEGPQRAGPTYDKETPEPTGKDNQSQHSQQFEVWYMHGTAEKEDLEACGTVVEDLEDPHVDCVVTMINARVVKAVQAPLDYGGYPYDVYPWRRRSGHWAGTGVGRHIRVAQEIVTGATRNLMDNAGIASGPMLIFKHGVVVPADGVAAFAPRKVWYIKYDDDTIKKAEDALGSVTVDMLTDDLLKIVEFGMKLGEDTTGLPMLLQGQMGAAPDTVGGMTMLNNNATAVLRRLARMFDDRITEPHIRRYYIWHLQYGPDEEKGDVQIDATGSSAMVERDIQNQELGNMGSIVLDPRFGLDPKKWAIEFLKSRHFDPKRMEMDDEQWASLLAEWGELQEVKKTMADPRVQVEQIRAQALLQKTEMEGQITGALKIAEQDHDSEENRLERELKVILKSMDERIGQLDTGVASADNDKKIKASLAESVMKIRSTMRLAGMKAPASAMPKPPIEPKGRAPAGESYQK